MNSSDGLIPHAWIVLTLYSVCALVRFIVVGLVNTESTVSATTFKTGSDWDRLLALWMGLNELFHDGAVISALYFLILFGRQVVSCLDTFCENILQHAETAVQMPWGASGAQGKLEQVVSIQTTGVSNKPNRLIDLFADLKVIFGIYSKIGGTFAFALVIELGMCLFFLLYIILFSSQSGGVSTWYIIAAILLHPQHCLSLHYRRTWPSSGKSGMLQRSRKQYDSVL